MSPKKILKNNLIIVVAVLVIYIAIIFYSDITKFSQVASRIDPVKISFALFLVGIGMFLFSLRFHRMVSHLGIQTSLRKNIAIFFFGLAFTVTPFGSGTLIKSHILKKETNTPISKTFPIILIEKWSDLTAITILLTIFLTLHYTLGFSVVAGIGVAIIAVFLLVAKSERMFLLFKKIVGKIPIVKKMIQNIDESKQTIQTLTSKKVIAEMIAFTITEKVLETIAVALIFDTIGIKLSLSDGGQVYFSGVLIGFLSLIPGGVGITEGSMLGSLVKNGTDFTLASASVITVRLVTFWLPVVMGIVTFRYFMKEKFSFG